MGLFSRFRSSSNARDTRNDVRTDSSANGANGANGATLRPSMQTVRRSASSNYLAPPQNHGTNPNAYTNGNGYGHPNDYQAPPRTSTTSTAHSSSSTATTPSRRPFWKRDKKELTPPSLPYSSALPGPPVRARADSTSPSIASFDTSRRMPQTMRDLRSPNQPWSTPQGPSSLHRQPAPTASPLQRSPAAVHRQPGAMTPQDGRGHARAGSGATVISLQSTFSGPSRKSTDSGQWNGEGGILGKLNFESDSPGTWDIDAMGKTSPRASALKNLDRSPGPRRKAIQPDLSRQQSAEQPIIPKRNPKRQTAPMPATTTTKFQASPLVSTPNLTADIQEDMEEIRPQETTTDRADDGKRWKLRSRRPSSDRPPSPTIRGGRNSTQTDIGKPPTMRRPSSSMFHMPFHRTQSRVSLESPGADDSSFQLKSFRHISGASDADGGFDKYLSLVTTPPATTPLGRSPMASPNGKGSSQTDLSLNPPRPRQPSLTGSVDSTSRVKMAAFRKGIRRPSSSVLADDDDIPLSLSRANMVDAGKREESAVSLSDMTSPPQIPALNLPPSPNVNGITISDPSPLNPSRAGQQPPSPNSQNNFVVKSGRSSRDRSSRNSLEISPARRDRVPSPADGPTTKAPTPPPPRATTLYIPLSDPVENSAAQRLSPQPTQSARASPTSRTGALVPPPRPKPAAGPQVRATDLVLPPRPDELEDPFTPPVRPKPESRPSSRGSGTGISLAVLDEPMRRISGFWGGSGDDERDEREEPFDPKLVCHSPQPISPSETRVSLYDRLASATTAAASSATNVVASATTVLSNSNSAQKLHIPPVPTTPPRHLSKELDDRSPSSDRTASPTGVPPAMKAPPAPPPAVPHSSFGRVPKKAADKKGTWDSSDEEDNATTPPARRTLKMAQPVPRPVTGPRTVSMVEPTMEEIQSSSEEEDMPLNALKGRSSRQSLRPSNDMARPSLTSLKANSAPQGSLPLPRMSSKSSLRPASVHTTSLLSAAPVAGPPALRSSASKWSLSSDSHTVSPTSEDGPTRPSSRPSSRNTTKGLSPSASHMMNSTSSSKLRTPALPTSAQPSPRRDAVSLVAAQGSRGTASPASSRSGLTGDSSTQQPMTPKSNDPSRRSWADGRSRPSSDTASSSQRPQTGDWASAVGSGAPPNFPTDTPSNPQQAAMMKQQFQSQWMAAAQRYFDDAWERASTVSAAQTAPGNHGGIGSGGPTYGYSYQNMPPPPASAYGGFSQNYGYSPFGGFPGPQVGFPGAMPGMPMGGMPMGGMPGMPPGMGGMPGMMPGMPGMPGMPMGPMPGANMYSYGLPAQSVYGGEFGPPVAPFQQAAEQPSSPRASPRARARRLSSNTDLAGAGRPTSVAHGMYSSGPSAASVTGAMGRHSRPIPNRRTSALTNDPGPPSSWRKAVADDEPTPRKRVTNAS